MSNEEQIEYWNGEAGQRWAAFDSVMEKLLFPATEALLEHADIGDSVSALDVGCGGGSQSLMLAESMTKDGKVLGIDISAPMLEVARAKLAQRPDGCATIEFQQADASTHPFEKDSFDLLFSRFGVMFFDDPVTTFSHLRPAMRSSAKLAFCCWQPLRDNPWTWLAVQAALQHLPPPEPTDPHAPGPFAFADPQRVESILRKSGFIDIQAEPRTLTLQFGDAPTLPEAVRKLAQIGPLGRLLIGHDEATLAPVWASIEAAMAPFYRDEALWLDAAIWLVTARTA
tara:strand:+ start:4867 stop:5718 length:852 start_codon:yes stop_codon:yes gene_type:complete